MNHRFFAGLDLGQAQDYTAQTVVERITTDVKPEFHLRHIHRYNLGTSHVDVVADVAGLMQRDELRAQTALVVDQTGVGRPVIEQFVKAKLKPVAVSITGGDVVTRDDRGGYRVPKRDLVSALQVLFQDGRFKVAKGLPFADVLVEELLNFRAKINMSTGHDTYEAWRERDHDDLVLSAALAVWYGRRVTKTLVPGLVEAQRGMRHASPFGRPSSRESWE